MLYESYARGLRVPDEAVWCLAWKRVKKTRIWGHFDPQNDPVLGGSVTPKKAVFRGFLPFLPIFDEKPPKMVKKHLKSTVFDPLFDPPIAHAPCTRFLVKSAQARV